MWKLLRKPAEQEGLPATAIAVPSLVGNIAWYTQDAGIEAFPCVFPGQLLDDFEQRAEAGHRICLFANVNSNHCFCQGQEVQVQPSGKAGNPSH